MQLNGTNSDLVQFWFGPILTSCLLYNSAREQIVLEYCVTTQKKEVSRIMHKSFLMARLIFFAMVTNYGKKKMGRRI